MSQKTILITGATGNLGEVVCKHLLSLGYQVIGTMRAGTTPPKIGVDFHECDLTSEDSTKDLFRNLQKEYSNLDAVLCLAGGFGMNSLSDASSSDMMKMFQLNYMTAFHTAVQSVQWLNESDHPHILFIGSKPALEGKASAVLPYAISKSAVVNLAQIINDDPNLNIKASVIVPSIIDTPPNREAMPDADFSKWVTPESIAENIAYLLSPSASALQQTVLKLYNES